ncbi:MAG: GntR family transcriptional regulator, partial [Geminicoccaceae bacterium]
RAFLGSGRVVEFTRSLYRGDAYDFMVELRVEDGGAGERNVQ